MAGVRPARNRPARCARSPDPRRTRARPRRAVAVRARAFATLAAVQRPPESSSVLYEVSLEADAAIAGPFDTWLRDHVADVLQSDGFQSAEILDDDSTPPGRIRRIVQYRLRDRAALEHYLATQAPQLEAAGRALFGDRYASVPRVLPHREEFVLGAFSTENCLNCGEVLRGQHCSHCGQHAQVRVLSLWGLVKDVVGDLLNADSRVWRTLWPLAFRPGLLTEDFLRGRRARYTPPFRMYLVLSVVFFVLASFEDPGGDIALQHRRERGEHPAARRRRGARGRLAGIGGRRRIVRHGDARATEARSRAARAVRAPSRPRSMPSHAASWTRSSAGCRPAIARPCARNSSERCRRPRPRTGRPPRRCWPTPAARTRSRSRPGRSSSATSRASARPAGRSSRTSRASVGRCSITSRR